jgi:hypothetical protein
MKFERGPEAFKKWMEWEGITEEDLYPEDLEVLPHMWLPTGEERDTTAREFKALGYKKDICTEIAVLIGVHTYEEEAPCWRKGNEAWIRKEVWEEIST